MEKQFIDVDARDTILSTAIHDIDQIVLPLLAIVLDLVPVFVERGPLTPIIPFIRLLMVLSPIAGVIIGIVSLNLGKNRTLSIIAIALPLIFVAFIILTFLFLGVVMSTAGGM